MVQLSLCAIADQGLAFIHAVCPALTHAEDLKGLLQPGLADSAAE